jgi:hypothetical protein
MARRPGLATLLVLTTLALGACALTDDEQTAADTISSALVTKQSPKSTEDTADCVAEKWVGEVGTTALKEDGVINDRFRARENVVREIAAGRQPVSEEVARGYAAAWLACADFDVIALDEEESHPDASGEVLDEYADCLKAIDDDLWRDAIAERLSGDPTSSADAGLTRELDDCRDELDDQAG